MRPFGVVWFLLTLAACALVHIRAYRAGRTLAYRAVANALTRSGNHRLARVVGELERNS